MTGLAYAIILAAGLSLIFWLVMLWRAERTKQLRTELIMQRLRRLRSDQQSLDWADEENASLAVLPEWTPNFIKVRIARADVRPSAGLVLSVVILLAAFVLLIGLTLGPVFALASFGLIIGLIFLALELIANRRLGDFREGLPGYFDRVRQLLLVGNTLQQGLGKALGNANEQTRRYLEPMVRRIDHGATVAESVGWLAQRIDVPEVHMFHAAIETNIRYGGRVTDILGNLIAMLKDQDRARRELGAATSETRGSANVLTGLPLVIALGFSVINPSYISFFIQHPTGHMLLGISTALILTGAYVLRRMMKQGGAG